MEEIKSNKSKSFKNVVGGCIGCGYPCNYKEGFY